MAWKTSNEEKQLINPINAYMQDISCVPEERVFQLVSTKMHLKAEKKPQKERISCIIKKRTS